MNLKNILIISFLSLALLIFLIYLVGFRPKEEILVIPEIVKKTQKQIEAFQQANPDEILNHPFFKNSQDYLPPITPNFPKGKTNPFE